MKNERVVDASDQILGRLSSVIAKSLMEGERITVFNAEKVIVTGEPRVIVESFRVKKRRGDPHHGPFYPKNPEDILKRSVRGMIPYKKPRGREALRRLSVYSGNPGKLKGEKIAKTGKEIECKSVSLGDISKKLRGI